MDVKISNDIKWSEVKKGAQRCLKYQVCMTRKKALQYNNTRRAGLLKGFHGDIYYHNLTGYINKKFRTWNKQEHGTHTHSNPKSGLQ